MDTLLHRFQGTIKGIIEGFDRFVFKGLLKHISYVEGMQSYLSRHRILNKNYKEWVTSQSQSIIQAAENYVKAQCGSDIQYISSCHTRKEELAHKQQKESGIQNGLIGIWSCLESCRTYKATYDQAAGFPQIKSNNSRCKHLYFYYDHQDLGFMSIRLQTWAPYEIQIALNGREWLRRQLDKAGIAYTLQGNKFFDIDDYTRAQTLLTSQLNTRWEPLLTSFLPDVFPTMRDMFGDDMSYTWILWQSEWAKDYLFSDPGTLNQHMEHLLRYAFITGTFDRVLRYMGRPVRKDSQPYSNTNPDLMTRLSQWYDGARIRHWVDQNSIKMYNEHNVLRFEFTMNDPTKYLIHRHIEGNKNSEKKLRPMRKGIADVGARAKISSNRIHCFCEHMATVTEPSRVGDLLSKVAQPIISKGKSYRALDVTGKDLELLRAISDPKYTVDAISNKHLRETLVGSTWAKDMTGKRLSARISRHLRLLREHGLIKKVPKQHKYQLTQKGRALTMALHQFLDASVEDLVKLDMAS